MENLSKVSTKIKDEVYEELTGIRYKKEIEDLIKKTKSSVRYEIKNYDRCKTVKEKWAQYQISKGSINTIIDGIEKLEVIEKTGIYSEEDLGEQLISKFYKRDIKDKKGGLIRGLCKQEKKVRKLLKYKRLNDILGGEELLLKVFFIYVILEVMLVAYFGINYGETGIIIGVILGIFLSMISQISINKILDKVGSADKELQNIYKEKVDVDDLRKGYQMYVGYKVGFYKESLKEIYKGYDYVYTGYSKVLKDDKNVSGDYDSNII